MLELETAGQRGCAATGSDRSIRCSSCATDICPRRTALAGVYRFTTRYVVGLRFRNKWKKMTERKRLAKENLEQGCGKGSKDCRTQQLNK